MLCLTGLYFKKGQLCVNNLNAYELMNRAPVCESKICLIKQQ